jgi:hypothetical protein
MLAIYFVEILAPTWGGLFATMTESSEHSMLLNAVDGIGETLEDGVEKIQDFWEEFTEFIDKGSIIQLGVGVLIGTQFGTVLSFNVATGFVCV